MTAIIDAHNIPAEQSLLGKLLEAPQYADVAGIRPSDLAEGLGHPQVLAAIFAVYEAKGTADPMLILDELNKRDQTSRVGNGDRRGAVYLAELMEAARYPGAISHYARLIREASYRRFIHEVGANLTRLAATAGDIDNVLSVAADLSLKLNIMIDQPLEGDAPIPGLSTVDEFVRQPSPPYSWVIPGMLERADRVILVAGEGVGKSYMARQICTLLAAGRHPFAPKQAIRPRRTLLVDLENSPVLVQRKLRGLVGQVWEEGLDVGDRMWRWNRPGGMDIRSQADQALLARVIEKVRPDLIAIGPLYKMSLGRPGDTYEIAAAETAAAIDRLRERYGVAFLIEHHMPKGDAGQRHGPIGSSLWQRWPEFGLELSPDPDGEGNVFDLGRFRGDRDDRYWPDQLMKGVTKWPWTAVFDDAENQARLYDLIDEDHADYLADQRIQREQGDYTTPPAGSGASGLSERSQQADNGLDRNAPDHLADHEDPDGDPR